MARDKARPIFSGKDPDIHFTDWLPSLLRAAKWNNWQAEEQLLQLAGHLDGTAHHEWTVLDSKVKATYNSVVAALCDHLDPSNYIMVAQDFRHLSQSEGEKVADFIRLLEGQSGSCTAELPETRDALFTQLQEGLKLSLMESPSVLGSTRYQSLCMAAKNKEHRQSVLRNATSIAEHGNAMFSDQVPSSGVSGVGISSLQVCLTQV